MPLDPDIKLTGLVANTAKMFASAVYPCVIEFKELVPPSEDQGQEASKPCNVITFCCVSNLIDFACLSVRPAVPRSHKIMFKSGDDLRQDQLIMQMIALMDSLLKKVNLFVSIHPIRSPLAVVSVDRLTWI